MNIISLIQVNILSHILNLSQFAVFFPRSELNDMNSLDFHNRFSMYVNYIKN